jgi:hypothetical protein
LTGATHCFIIRIITSLIIVLQMLLNRKKDLLIYCGIFIL